MSRIDTLPNPAVSNGSTARAPRGWVRIAALAALTAGVLYLCVRLVAPFLPGLTWAVAIAVVGLPLHRWVRRRIPNESWAAGVSTAAVVLALTVSVVWAADRIAHELSGQSLQERVSAGQWRETLTRIPYIGGWIGELGQYVSVEQEAKDVMAWAGRATVVVGGTLWGALQILLAVFVLYFCFRDHGRLLAALREMVPLDRADTDRVIGKAGDAIHATVYGTIVAGLIQGVTGGLLFWALGLPAPVLWGVVMFVLGILPFLGAFVVWVPAAIVLASGERWGAAAALVAWGLMMAGPVCNYVYAIAAGDRMKMHPVPALLAFIGGLAVFGISGMVLGPVIFAVAAAVLDIWRHHVMRGRPADGATGG